MGDAQVLPSQQVASLSPEAHAHWKLTGEINPKASAPPPDAPHRDLSEPADTSTVADSSPAEPAEQAPEIAGSQSTASEPVTPKKKSNAETRIKELLARQQELEAENTRLKAEPRPASPDVKPAVSSPAEKPKSLAEFVARPDLSKPRIDEVEFFSQFPDARLADYQDYRESYRDARMQIQSSAETRTRAIQDQFQDRIKATVEADPQLWDGLPEALKTAQATGITLDPNSPRTAWNDIARELVTSEASGALLAHFKAHPDDLTQIAGLPDELSVTRAIARLEARLTSDPVNPQKTVRQKTVTSAPEPQGTTLGRRTQGVIDDAEGAIQRKDAGSYIAIMNRREASAR